MTFSPNQKGLSKQEIEKIQECEVDIRKALIKHGCFLSFNGSLVIPVPHGVNEFLAWQWFYADMNSMKAKLRPFSVKDDK